MLTARTPRTPRTVSQAQQDWFARYQIRQAEIAFAEAVRAHQGFAK